MRNVLRRIRTMMSSLLCTSFGIACLLLSAPSSQAATAWVTAVPTTIYPMADGSFAIGFEAAAPACSNSGSTRYVYVAVGQNGVNADGIKNMLATALTAYSMGKSLSIAYDDSSYFCYVNRFLTGT